MQDQMSLDGRTAIVTGGANGIGAAVSRLYGQAGAQVVIYDRDEEALKSFVGELRGEGLRAEPVHVDITDRKALAEAVNKIEGQFDGIDILANIAGITQRTEFFGIDETALDAMLQTHVAASFYTTQLVAEGMRERQYGKIINTASLSGVRGQGTNVHYGVAKAGIVGLTKSTAKALGPYRITVNSVSPFAYTAMTKNYEEFLPGRELPLRTVGRLGEPEDVAPTYHFLAAPASDYMTGCNVFVDGGYHLGPLA